MRRRAAPELPGRGLLIALAVGSVTLAWTWVHTVYLLRYARVYYGPRGGTVIVAIMINIVAGLLGR